MTEPLRLGSLCTGYGGLDLAAHDLLGAVTVWCAEFDAAPSQIIEHRLPGVPNLHDVTAIPWRIVAPVDVLTAGYPCQPFSLAGARKGADDERHLWPSILEGIKALRPRHALFENVRGHLSLGFDRVLADLAHAGYAVTWRIVAAADVGACHRRERLFIYAQPIEYAEQVQQARAFARVQGDGLVVAEPDLFGDLDEYREPLPISGRMVGGVLYVWAPAPVQPELAHASLMLPTPNTMEDLPAREGEAMERHRHRGDLNGSRRKRSSNLRERVVEELAEVFLPTPAAGMPNDGESPEQWQARKDHHASKDENATRAGMPLAIAVKLLPTATASDQDSSGANDPNASTLTDAIVRTDRGRIPNPRHLPTPDAAAGERGAAQDPAKRRAGGHSITLDDVVTHLPTPAAADGSGGRISKDDTGIRADGSKRSITLATVHRTDASTGEWGPYALAISQHTEFVTGTTPPQPTQLSRNGKPQLAAPFVEWMMGLESGWVTETGLTRRQELKALGNGVVPQQALAAYRTMGVDRDR